MEDKNIDVKMIMYHRPLKIDTHVVLPIDLKKDDDERPKILDKELNLVGGVLTINIGNLPKTQWCKPTPNATYPPSDIKKPTPKNQ